MNNTQKHTGRSAVAPAVTLPKRKLIHIRKLSAILEMKSTALFSKNFIIGPIFAIGFAFLMDRVYNVITDGAVDMSGMALAMGVLMNICMTGVYVTAACLAEEKEKYTLRTLMTSSVNGLEFCLGSLIPVIVMQAVVNVLCVFASGFSMNPGEWAAYLAVSTACAIIGSVIGMIFGIFAKNQMSAGTITTPALLVLMMIPMFSSMIGAMEKVSSFLFTGVVYDAILKISMGEPPLEAKGIVILLAEILISVVLFLALYRKNGLER